jgi:hypothetical protein
MQLSAFDPEEQPLSFSISGGDDSYHFELTPSGVLNFVDPPDFDNPADADGDNRYQLSVTAFDGVNQSMQAIVITVDENLISTNDIEAQGVTAGGADDSASTDDSTSGDDSASTDDTESMDASNDVDLCWGSTDNVTSFIVEKEGAVFGNDQDAVGDNFSHKQAFEGEFYGLKIYDKFFDLNNDGDIPEGVSLIYSLSPGNIASN